MTRAPLTPADCDLRDFSRMMIDISRLRQSAFDAIIDDAAWRAGVNLWFSAWHSVPAGSLANDDASLAKAAGLGRDVRTWQSIREDALRGFVECNDGRLYHETVCEFVLEAWIEKLLQRISSGAGNAKRWGIEFDPLPLENAIAQTATLLAKLSPGSKALAKARRKRPAGNPTGKDEVSHRDQEQLPLGSQETGTGTEKGNIDIDVVAREPARARKPEVDPFDVANVADALARRAGVPHLSPSQVARNIDTVRQWHGDKIDIAIVEAEIDRFRLDQPDQRVSALSFFEQSVRAKVAHDEARKRKGSTVPRPTMGKPVAPLACRDEDDDRLRTIRAGFNGNPTLTPDKVALAIGDDEGEPFLIVNVRSAFVRSQLDRTVLEPLARQAFGSMLIDVRVQ